MNATDNTLASFINTCQNVHFLGSMAVAAAPHQPTEKMINWLLVKVGGEVEDLLSFLENIESIKPRPFSGKMLGRTRQTLESIGVLVYFAKQSPHISMQAFKRLSMQITLQIDSIIRDIPDEVMEAVL